MTPAIACSVCLFQLALAAAVPAALPRKAPAPVSFTLDRGVILIPLRIGGEGPFTFVLDTGSSRSAISHRLAARLHAPTVARSRLVSLGETSVRPVVRLPMLALGDIQKRGILATVFDSSELHALAGNVDGILGMDVLGDRRYTLDYRRKLLRWDTSALEEAKARVKLPVRWAADRCLVAVTHPDGEPIWFVADSGADTVILFRTPDRKPLPAREFGQRMAVQMAGGRQFADRILLHELKLGPVVLRDVPAIRIPVTRDPDIEGQGLLPLRLFAQVVFDPASASIIVIPR